MCNISGGRLAEIQNSKENDEIQKLVLDAQDDGCNDLYYFGVVYHRGYMWFSHSESNVSYRNFDEFIVSDQQYGIR